MTDRPTVENVDPLKTVLNGFVESVQTDCGRIVSAGEGIRALDFIEAIRLVATEG